MTDVVDQEERRTAAVNPSEPLTFETARRMVLADFRRWPRSPAEEMRRICRLLCRFRERHGWNLDPEWSLHENFRLAADALAYHASDPDEGLTVGVWEALVWAYWHSDEWLELWDILRHHAREGILGEGTCRDCRKQILWATTENYKSMPLDPYPVRWDKGGEFLLQSPGRRPDDTRVIYAPKLRDETPAPDEYGLRCHLESCPEG